MGEIEVLHIPCNVPYIQKLHEPGCIKIVNTFNTPSFAWLNKQARNSMWFSTFDVCHIHFGFEFEPIEVVQTALDLLKERGKPIVFTIHELSSVHGVTGEVYQQYMAMICDYATSYITLSEGAKHEFQDVYGTNLPVSVTPHGRVSICSHEGGRLRSKKTVLMYGSLRKNRNILTTFINVALASADKWNLRWITKPFTDMQLQDPALQVVIKLHDGSSASIETTLPMSDSEMVQMVAGADVLVLPYLEAGHSGQLELAFDCGTPVVSAKVGFLYDQTKFWPEKFRSNVNFVDWSDGKRWLYQQRIVSAVRQVVNADRHDRMILERIIFRESEHKKIIRAHRRIYEEALSKT